MFHNDSIFFQIQKSTTWLKKLIPYELTAISPGDLAQLILQGLQWQFWMCQFPYCLQAEVADQERIYGRLLN
jgi:hypothetical protein